MEDTPYIIVDHPKPKPPFMRRMLKKLVIFVALVFGLVFLSAVVVAAFFEEEIGKKLVVEINKSLNSELTVKDFNLSLLSGFPNASGDLQDVVLLEAEKNVFPVWSNELVSFQYSSKIRGHQQWRSLCASGSKGPGQL